MAVVIDGTSGISSPDYEVDGVTGQIYSLVSGTAVTASGTSVDFTGIPSWVKRITVMFSGVSTSGSSNYQVQIGSGSVTTSGYACGFTYVSSGAATANATSGFVVANPSSAAVVFSGILTIALVSSNTWVSSHVMGETDAARAMLGGGNLLLSAAH
jgi:hypothetical protein